MTDKEELQAAFVAGFVRARKSGFTTNELDSVTKQAAISGFERWHELEYKDE